MSKFSSDSVKGALIEAVKVLGYQNVKKHQVESFVLGTDVFAVLPTGYGKSLCFACLPMVFDKLLKMSDGFHIVLVVTPLVAIIKDQISYIHFWLCVCVCPCVRVYMHMAMHMSLCVCTCTLVYCLTCIVGKIVLE